MLQGPNLEMYKISMVIFRFIGESYFLYINFFGMSVVIVMSMHYYCMLKSNHTFYIQ